jgi:ubiquitin-protein ligase
MKLAINKFNNSYFLFTDTPFEGGTFRLIVKFDSARSFLYPPKVPSQWFFDSANKEGNLLHFFTFFRLFL